MQLICDSNRGIYAPQQTILSLCEEIVNQLPKDAVNDVLDGPDNEWYWKSWEDILNQTVTFEGKTYRLDQDEDVWMMEEGEEFNND